MTKRTITFFVISVNLVAVVVASLIYIYTEKDNFLEDGFITKLSFAQLLIISCLSILILRIRQSVTRRSIFKRPLVLWVVVALGFFFLAADEIYEIHEGLDEVIHRVFGWQETALSDRIDDFLVALYGLTAMSVLAINFNELKIFPESFPWFGSGFVLLFAMVLLDSMTNEPDLLLMFFERDRAMFLYTWLANLEDSFKVFAEGCFIIAFFSIYQKSKQLQF